MNDLFTNNVGESVDTGTHCEPTVDAFWDAMSLAALVIAVSAFVLTALYFGSFP